MLKNGQTCLKTITGITPQNFKSMFDHFSVLMHEKVKITAWFIKLQVGWPIGKLFHSVLYHSCSKHFRQISKKQPQELFFLKKIAGYRASLMKKGSFSLEFFLGIVLWLTRFSLMPHVYTTWKPQKSFGFLMFSGGLEMEHWIKIGEL